MIRRAILGVLLVAGAGAHAKNLDGRVGFGLNYLDFTATPAVSLKYFHTPLLASQFLAGFNTAANQYQLGIKTVRHVVLEENMNLFIGVAGYVLSNATNSGAEFDALFGGEFFLPGLPNLGILFEVGIGLRSLGVTSFRSMGGGFASGAIHYYF